MRSRSTPAPENYTEHQDCEASSSLLYVCVCKQTFFSLQILELMRAQITILENVMGFLRVYNKVRQFLLLNLPQCRSGKYFDACFACIG